MALDAFTPDEIAEFFHYLDTLRASGETNMFGCGPYLMEEFGVSRKDAHTIAGAWSMTFDGAKPLTDRVKQALAAAS